VSSVGNPKLKRRCCNSTMEAMIDEQQGTENIVLEKTAVGVTEAIPLTDINSFTYNSDEDG
jgi:hypothetical protein